MSTTDLVGMGWRELWSNRATHAHVLAFVVPVCPGRSAVRLGLTVSVSVSLAGEQCGSRLAEVLGLD